MEKIEKIEKIEVNGVFYTPVDKTGQARHIVLLGDGGLTYVGFADFSTSDYPKILRDAQCVIKWGTKKHLSQLANDGPLENTRLGAVCDLVITRPPLGAHPCNEGAWTLASF